METLLLILGAAAAAWFAILMWWPRSARRPDPDGFSADQALTTALDESVFEHARFRGHL